MNEEELNNIQELIERKILLAEVSGGLTSSDKKVIDLWNYTIDLQQENQQLKEDIKGYEQEIQKLYNSMPFKENKQLKDRVNKAIKLIEEDYYSLNTTNIDKVYEFNIPLQVRKILKGVENDK